MKKPTGQCIYTGDAREAVRAGYTMRDPTKDELENGSPDMVLLVDRNDRPVILEKK